jgi:hypothetical protein
MPTFTTAWQGGAQLTASRAPSAHLSHDHDRRRVGIGLSDGREHRAPPPADRRRHARATAHRPRCVPDRPLHTSPPGEGRVGTGTKSAISSVSLAPRGGRISFAIDPSRGRRLPVRAAHRAQRLGTIVFSRQVGRDGRRHLRIPTGEAGPGWWAARWTTSNPGNGSASIMRRPGRFINGVGRGLCTLQIGCCSMARPTL